MATQPKPGQVTITGNKEWITRFNEPGTSDWVLVKFTDKEVVRAQLRMEEMDPAEIPGFDWELAGQIAGTGGEPPKVRTISDNCLKLIEQFEGLKLAAYPDPVGIWTVGLGTTRYPDGKPVRKGDKITREQAYEYARHDLNKAFQGVDKFTRDDLNQNQVDALTSFAYNVGISAYSKSTLLRLVNADPNDPAIRTEFARWNKAKGKVLKGLTRRRAAEAELYFS